MFTRILLGAFATSPLGAWPDKHPAPSPYGAMGRAHQQKVWYWCLASIAGLGSETTLTQDQSRHLVPIGVTTSTTVLHFFHLRVFAETSALYLLANRFGVTNTPR